jgi:hypothetical protein
LIIVIGVDGDARQEHIGAAELLLEVFHHARDARARQRAASEDEPGNANAPPKIGLRDRFARAFEKAEFAQWKGARRKLFGCARGYRCTAGRPYDGKRRRESNRSENYLNT